MQSQFVLTQLYLKNGSLSHGDDEDFIAKAIEDKASYHGRRHDTVLYTSQRVKKKNLLTIANYRLAQRGKKLIRSATTVYNRARPRKKRSVQAKRHTGKGLFCWKNHPKARKRVMKTPITKEPTLRT